MTIMLIIFFFNVIAAFVSGVTGHTILYIINIALAVLMFLSTIIYEGQLLNRIKSLEQEVDILKRRM